MWLWISFLLLKLFRNGSVSASTWAKLPGGSRLYLKGNMRLAALHTMQGFASAVLALGLELGVFQLLGETSHTPTEAERLLLLRAQFYLSRGFRVAEYKLQMCSLWKTRALGCFSLYFHIFWGLLTPHYSSNGHTVSNPPC